METNTLPSFEDIDIGRGMPTLYRVAFKSQLDSLFTYGYNRAFTGSKGGNMYGPGVYCTFNLEDTIENVKTKSEYGDCIVQMRLLGGFKGFIIFDEKLARKTYGDKWLIRHQLENVANFSEQDAIVIENECRRESELYHGRTAPAAYYIWRKFRSSLFKDKGVRGLIYKGNRDGHCALPYDFSAVIPYAVSFDKGKTFKKRFNKELYNYIMEHSDVEFLFGNQYQSLSTPVRGFTIVQNSQGKYNVVRNATKTPISNEWFDMIDGNINPNSGIFGFNYLGIHFYGSIESPQEGIIGCIIDPFEKEPYCEFSDLKPLVQDIKSHGLSSFEEYLMAEDDEEIPQQANSVSTNESRRVNRIIENVLNNFVKKLIKESRSVDQDGFVTVDNFDDVERLLLKPENQDDVWFVQIIKRHKDNMHLHFQRNACEYITSYLIHDSDELEKKRSEIMAVCNSTNSRAYMHPNKRSLISITDYANNVLKPRFIRHNVKGAMGHEIEIAAGQSKDWLERKLCFLDIDSDDVNVYNKVMGILKQHGIEPMWEYRSLNNGWHILLPDKEKVRNIDFSVIDNGYNFGRFSTVGFEIDKPILLYAKLRPNGYGVQQKVQQNKKYKRYH